MSDRMPNPFCRFKAPPRLILAILLAPLIGDAISIAIFMIIGALRLNDIGMFFAGLMYAYPTTILIGLPYHLILRHQFKRHSYWAYAIGGFVIGTAVLVSIFSFNVDILQIAIGFGGCPGIAIALAARWIVGPIEKQSTSI